jgi:Pyridoxamine 5'-phosphate oxidase
MSVEPRSVRAARFPADYGAPGAPADLLPWSFVDERLRAAPNYWITTVTSDGRPHARPVDGVWVDGTLCFGGGSETRWVRNLQANPLISAHLASETEAVILEGSAELITDANDPLVGPSEAATRAKYPQYYTDKDVPFQPFWALRPRAVYAWTLADFPRRAARWTVSS